MQITRRNLILGATAIGAGGMLPLRPSFGATQIDMGGLRIDTVSDGNLVLPADFLLGGDVPLSEIAPVLERNNISPDQLTPPCNVTLLRDGTNTVLFDVGSGQDFMPSAGKLLETLEALDVTPEDVTHVVFTHGHPDHIWGLLDDFDDPTFPEAEYLMGRVEFDYWMDPDTVNTISEGRVTFAVGAKRRLEAIDGQISFFEDGAEILPGVAAQATFGHTPGHMAFELRSGNQSAMLVGDAIVNHHVGFERPELPSGSDQDQDMGIATRMALLDQLASQQVPMIGFHLPNGGVGRAERHDNSYRFVPEV
ncbi:MAG: MBL fold metallo-hydrolase [Litoreibacter sp.]|nr:MBL fold metallo-hydrolase [Litoreibacter sp.]